MPSHVARRFRDCALRVVRGSFPRLVEADADAFRSGLALVPKLEVLDVMRMGYDREDAAPLLIPCMDVLPRLRVFVAPRCASLPVAREG